MVWLVAMVGWFAQLVCCAAPRCTCLHRCNLAATASCKLSSGLAWLLKIIHLRPTTDLSGSSASESSTAPSGALSPGPVRGTAFLEAVFIPFDTRNPRTDASARAAVAKPSEEELKATKARPFAYFSCRSLRMLISGCNLLLRSLVNTKCVTRDHVGNKRLSTLPLTDEGVVCYACRACCPCACCVRPTWGRAQIRSTTRMSSCGCTTR